MAQIKKRQKFDIGQQVRIKDDKAVYQIVDARYIIFAGGEDWQYTLRGNDSGSGKVIVGDKNIFAIEKRKEED